VSWTGCREPGVVGRVPGAGCRVPGAASRVPPRPSAGGRAPCESS